MIESAVVIDLTGKISKVFNGVYSEFIDANTSDNDIILYTDPPENRASYWDFTLEDWVDVGKPPTKFHVYDYVAKDWNDPRNLEEHKLNKWNDIKHQRDAIEFGGFEFEGDIYDSDQVSQGRILGASIAGLSQVWTLANNSTRLLTASQLQQLYAALQTHTALVHERGRIAREAIMSATTKEDVEAVTL